MDTSKTQFITNLILSEAGLSYLKMSGYNKQAPINIWHMKFESDATIKLGISRKGLVLTWPPLAS